MIALVLCSNSPQKIGTLVWREHPTLQAIIKMVTSKRFRFPTVDCDEVEKMNMKKLDYAAREEVRYFTNILLSFDLFCSIHLVANRTHLFQRNVALQKLCFYHPSRNEN